ncbi:hypothetical protein QYE76_006167 [Lolium multiflorum]|uniref:Uncharacterized protein n=1 Tax=Lolium multiflorum TaxID=4521 RepID=A0AAD8RVU7_LOLMU|nr:hypothetical protein QYE76_006167 [Lolium multiflorum]
MSHQYSPSGPALGAYQGEMPLQSRPPLPFALAAPEVLNSSASAVNMARLTHPGGCQPRFSFDINMIGLGYHPGDGKLGYGFTSADELEEVDIGPGDKLRPTFISKRLDPHLRGQMIALLKEYRLLCMGLHEMPGLDRSIIEHRLPLKKGFRPFQQRVRMKAEILEEVKKEIEKMLAAGFIGHGHVNGSPVSFSWRRRTADGVWP